ncbi:MAG: universal stress protein [Pseudomonadota bacterium]
MGRKRRSFEQGHRRKFLVVVDNTPECSRAIAYAAKRAERTNGGLVMLYVIKPSEFQHWLGVENIMRAEAQQEAQATLSRYQDFARLLAKIDPEQVVKEGAPNDAITELVEEDEDIAILVLAAGIDGEGPGPLVASFTRSMSTSFPIPMTIVPGDLSDEDIEALA